MSRTTSFKDLMPGENYTITISSTSKSDRYTEALTHSSKFEEVIPPIAPQHVPQNWNDQCEEVQTNPGFAHIPNVTWHVKYYCDEFVSCRFKILMLDVRGFKNNLCFILEQLAKSYSSNRIF